MTEKDETKHIHKTVDEAGNEHTVKLSDEDRKLVEEGRLLAKNMDSHQFKIGKLALSFAPIAVRGGYRRGPGQQERTAEFAQLIGVRPGTVRQYRTVVHAWRETDVKEDEFQWRILQQNVRVADKKAFIERLRKDAPEGVTRSWHPTKVKKLALDEKLYSPAKGGRPPKKLTPETKAKNLLEIANRLREITLTSEDREKIDPLLSRIQAESDRLRRELIEATQKEAATQVSEDVADKTPKKVIDKERLLPKAGVGAAKSAEEK